jgi:hypothetical protein
MMYIREILTNACPKVYAQAIIIGARYSLFRKQGLGEDKAEMRIIDYLTQQEKVLTRIAEYYAITIGGARIREVSANNR